MLPGVVGDVVGTAVLLGNGGVGTITNELVYGSSLSVLS